MRFFGNTLRAFMVLGFLASSLEAKPKKASNATQIAAPDPKKDPKIKKILSDLRPAFPHLTAGEIVRTSNNDLRRMYEQLYRAEGLSLHESKQKASAVLLKED